MKAGLDLAEARARLGLSLEDISRTTKVSVERLAAIEQGDLEHLPTLVYLKGFLRAYATEVNLDGDDITQRYLAELAQASAPAAPPDSNPADGGVGLSALPADDAGLGEFASEGPPDLRSAPEEIVSRRGYTVRPAHDLDRIEPDPTERGRIEWDRIEPDEIDVDREARPALAPVFGAADRHVAAVTYPPPDSRRLPYGAILIVLAAAVVAGLLFSANFDRVTTQRASGAAEDAAPAGNDAVRAAQREEAVAPAAAASAGPVPPASAAAGPGNDPSPARADDAERRAADARRAAAAREARTVTPPATTARTAEAAAERGEPTTERGESTTRKPAPVVSEAAEDARDNLSGSWTLSNRVESTSYGAFEQLNLGYRLQLQQNGDRITGTGQKWMENGKALPAGRRTPITIEGTRDGQRLELNFTEQGTLRTSRGTFVMQVTGDGTLQGRFMSEAANSEGSSLARRTAPPRD